MPKLKPTQKQLDFLSWEVGMFFHFGIRAFFPGHSDWDHKPMPASAFNPTNLDCDRWMRVAKAAGARYAILTCKHHDGFANWQSKYSDYSVAQSPWEGGKGDVVDLFVKACRKNELKVGLYYSPAQWGGAVKFDDPVEYDDYFINQISELLSNYGKIDYLWFDGNGSGGHEYDKTRIIKTIRTLQPDILIFSMWDADTRWVTNEDGYADMPNVNIAVGEHPIDDTPRYLPAECDMKLRSTWFDCEANDDTIKSVEELVGIYEYSVGRGANLLLNVGPDARGLIPEADEKRVREFGEAIRRRYENPLKFVLSEQKSNEWHYKLEDQPWEDTTLVDTVVIEEDITNGEAVEEFRVFASLPNYKKPICVYNGRTVGHKAICRFPTFRTSEITVVVDRADGEAVLRSVKVYHTAK